VNASLLDVRDGVAVCGIDSGRIRSGQLRRTTSKNDVVELPALAKCSCVLAFTLNLLELAFVHDSLIMLVGTDF
jgi:hypothetical protein